MEWPPCASSDSGRVPCTLSSPATGAGAATLAAEAAEEGVRERRDEERRAGRMTSSIHRWSRLIFPVFNASLSFCALFLSLVATRPMRREARGEAKHCTHVYLGSKKKQKNSPQLQFDVLCSSGSSRVVAGGVASSAPTSSSTSSSSSASACYDEELYFRGRTVLSSACGVTMKRYTCSERVVAAEYCHFSSNGGGSSAPPSPDDDDSDDDTADADSRGSSGCADEALAVVCESSVVSLCPGAVAVECPLDRGGRDRAWRLPRGCGLLLSRSSASPGAAPAPPPPSPSSPAPPPPPPPVVLSHPMEEPATLPAIRYAEGTAEEWVRGGRRQTAEGEEGELGDLGGEAVLFVGRLLPSSSGSSPASCPALGDRIELRDTGWFAVTTRSDASEPSAAVAATPSTTATTTTTTTLWALSRCSAKAAAAAPSHSSSALAAGAGAGAPQNSTGSGGAFASTPGGGGAAAAAAWRGAAAAAGMQRTPAGAPVPTAAAAAAQQQLGLSPTAAATARAAALAAATAGKGRRCGFFSLPPPLLSLHFFHSPLS